MTPTPEPTSPRDAGLDPDLAALLASVDQEPTQGELDELLASVRSSIEAARSNDVTRLHAQPTWRRRAFGFATLIFLLGMNIGLRQRTDLEAYALPYLLTYGGAVVSLISVCAFLALRPLHVPSLPRGTGFGLGLVAVAATVVLAVSPGFHAHAASPSGVSLFSHASPCLVYGFFVGVPIYGALRLLDRGQPLGRVLAASAAGLAGNLVLELQCPTGGGAHRLFGHAGVVALYVFGVIALEWALRPRT